MSHEERTGHNERGVIKEQPPFDNHSSETSIPTIVFKHTQVHYRNEDGEKGNQDGRNRNEDGGNRNQDENDNTMKCVNQLVYKTPGDIYIHHNKHSDDMKKEDGNSNGVDKLTADKKTSKTVQWADDVTIKDIPHASVTGVTQPLVVRTTYVINYNVLLVYSNYRRHSLVKLLNTAVTIHKYSTIVKR